MLSAKAKDLQRFVELLHPSDKYKPSPFAGKFIASFQRAATAFVAFHTILVKQPAINMCMFVQGQLAAQREVQRIRSKLFGWWTLAGAQRDWYA